MIPPNKNSSMMDAATNSNYVDGKVSGAKKNSDVYVDEKVPGAKKKRTSLTTVVYVDGKFPGAIKKTSLTTVVCRTNHNIQNNETTIPSLSLLSHQPCRTLLSHK